MPDIKIKLTRMAQIDSAVLNLLHRLMARSIMLIPDKELLPKRRGSGALAWIAKWHRTDYQRVRKLIELLDNAKIGKRVRLQDLLYARIKQARLRAGR